MICSRQIVVAEFVGTALLLAAVVGSGIMGERLAGGNIAVTLLATSIAAGAILATLILTFGPQSGAHFNPVITLALAYRRYVDRPDVWKYLLAQMSGALAGVAWANVMFGLPVFSLSQQVRVGSAQVFSEFIATFGLLVVL